MHCEQQHLDCLVVLTESELSSTVLHFYCGCRYLPMQCFHEVESVGRTIGLSLWFDYHGLRTTFGGNVQGGGFSSREVLAVLLSDRELGDQDASYDAEKGDEDPGAHTVLASLAGCLWADPVTTCTDFEAATIALRQLEEGT